MYATDSNLNIKIKRSRINKYYKKFQDHLIWYDISFVASPYLKWLRVRVLLTYLQNTVPFRMSKLVTRLRASLGDLLKNLGVRFGGRVSGLRLPVPVSHARIDPCGFKRSKFSVDAGRG